MTIRAWRARFEAEGVESVGKIAPGRGRPPSIGAARIEAIVTDTLTTVPDDGSVAWSTRSMGERHGVGKDTVARIGSRGLRPWKVDTFKLSNDPNFEDKVIDVVGLYLNPPEAAAVFAFVKRPRSSPGPDPAVAADDPGPGRDHDSDYRRNGTVDLFAAMTSPLAKYSTTRKRHAGTDV